ncbi:uncharacterized protein Dwil_GK12686 [Drosophila willistoni]|uniref:Kazal-like domain-containing protein n=1 Tax=Drosophila willistoni TaxID=7260 RepID=B4N4T6_DROWI|nr:MAGE-like protein 2 [Drosophila willistoni]EDW79160.1 uncharacterized protein Dwil_GK12686 [Drosophila willistoni]
MLRQSFLLVTAVWLCSVVIAAQVVPHTEIGRITIQVPLLSNGKPVIAKDQDKMVEIARVEEIKPVKKVTTNEVVVPPLPLAKARSTRAIRESSSGGYNHGIPNPGIPNQGIPNPGIPNRGLPNPGIPNEGIPNPGIPNRGLPNPGIPNPGLPNPGIPNDGLPNPGIPNRGLPNPGIPNPGLPNPGVPHPEASEQMASVTVLPPVMKIHRMPARKSCHHLLFATMTTTSPAMLSPPSTPEKEDCDQLCTKHEYLPICAFNGICLHEFANECVMDTFNCKHRDLAFRMVDEEVCRMDLCARRCKPEELQV